MTTKKRMARATRSGAVQQQMISPVEAGKGLRKMLAEATGIVNEILYAMDQALAAQGKSFTSTALEEWTPKLWASVFNRLANGGDWAADQANVIAVAEDMARIGAILSASSSTVNKGRAHAAFRAVKEHATCPGDLGSGRWCDFDI